MADNPARAKWNRIYANSSAEQNPGKLPFVLSDNGQYLPSFGSALDLACGRGAGAIYLARAGMDVEAWDISDTAVDDLNRRATQESLAVRANALDINSAALAGRSFDLVLICHYLDRQLLPAVKAALKPGGLLFMQTFTADKVVDIGPGNPEYLLGPDELLNLCRDLEVLRYRDEGGNPDSHHPLAGRAYIVARKAPKPISP